MDNLQNNKHSFSTKLTAFILLVATSVFIFALWGYYSMARKQVQKESISHAESELSTTIMQIGKILESVEIAVENLSWVIPHELDNPEEMYAFTRRLVENNPFIMGSTLAFRPNYYKEKGYFFAPYTYRDGKKILSKQLGNPNYDYHEMNWYKDPKNLEEPDWCEPYFDKGGGNSLMTTYSMPLYDKDGNFVAVFTADISLHWLSDALNQLKPYKHAFTVMIDKTGTYMAHPKTEKILKEDVFNSPTKIKRRTFREIAHNMTEGRKGFVETLLEEEDVYIFYAPITAAGWSVALICPQFEIFSGVNKMLFSVLIVTVIGLFLMSVLCYWVIRNLTKPLLTFTLSARKIAEGNFKTELPDIHSKDEMRTLRDSFEFMQKSLIEYMEELKMATARKERIESELRIASQIQKEMIPQTFPPFSERNDIDLYANLIPAKEVGGDLYDFFLLNERLYFILGDVSGKGVPASMFMAVICKMFRAVSTQFNQPSKIVSVLNDTLTMRNESNMFCTAFVGVLDLKTGQLNYCNAGHNPPFLISSKGTVTSLQVIPNLPLGLFEEFSFEEQQIEWPEGVSLFLYTDGVTEAENEKKQLYSDERLEKRLSASYLQRPEQMVKFIIKDVQHFAGSAEQSDDITILCLKYVIAGRNHKNRN